MSVTAKKSSDQESSIDAKRKRDALALAQLIYDIFQERKNDVRLDGGQNQADESNTK